MATKIISINIPNIELELIIDLLENKFHFGEKEEIIRFLKNIYTTKELFNKNFLDKIRKIEYFDTKKFCNDMYNLYDETIPYSFEDAFKITDNQYRAFVFGTINIHEMINSLGAIRIATDGKTTMQKKYDANGNYIDTIEITNVYEVYEVSGKNLNLNENIYAIKCWCTTTNNEHWLWIDEKYKNKPLEAIASTFMIHENLIPYIKEIKRQGDVLFVELKKESKNIKLEGKIVPFTAEQYFSLLSAQT